MKLTKAFSLWEDLRLSFMAAVGPAVAAIKQDPLLIFKTRALMRLIFFHVWRKYGGCADQGGSEVKTDLITPHAKGIVLEIGAGLGHTARYLDHGKVTKYVALEPNALMHPFLREEGKSHGFTEETGTLQILSCGAEDSQAIISQIGGQVDTLISILTLCSVPSPQNTIRLLAEKVIKPGGQFLFREHVANKRWDVRMWQRFWSPIWGSLFDGCILYRPSDIYIQNLTCWEPFPGEDEEGNRTGFWTKVGEDEDSLFPHETGRLIKAGAS